MKYLYRILRLFFCPHNYETISKGVIRNHKGDIGNYYNKECKYCGKMKRFNLEV